MYYWQTTKTSYEPVICEPVKKKTTHYSLLRPAENTVGDLFHTVEPTDIYYLVMENTFLLSYSIVVWIKQELFGFFFWLDWKRSLLVFETLQFPVQGSLMQIKTQSGSGWPQRDRSSLHWFQTNGFCTLSLILKTITITYPAHNLLFLSSEMCA